MKNYIVNIPEYNPENVVYGFVTKFLPGCTHHYDWRNGVYPEAASNRRAVLEMLGFGSRQLAMVNQVHGTNCVIIEEADCCTFQPGSDNLFVWMKKTMMKNERSR